VTTIKHIWQTIDGALNILHNSTTTKATATTTDTTAVDTALHSEIKSTSDKPHLCINNDEQQVLWYIRVWICVSASLTTLSIGAIAVVACIAALTSDTPTCQYCNTGDTSSSSSNTGKCRLQVCKRYNEYE
jgi:hypothetical protein